MPESLSLKKLQPSGLELYLKRDPGTYVFLLILWDFLRTPFFNITPPVAASGFCISQAKDFWASF